jgi:hypothetical protein
LLLGTDLTRISRPSRRGGRFSGYDVDVLARSIVVCAFVVISACGERSCDGGRSASTSVDAGDSRIGSCDRVTSMSVCSEYSGASLGDNEQYIIASCGKLGGAFAYAGCPNTAVLGTCTMSTGEARKLYGSGGATYDAPRAQKECESSLRGRWAPFP